MRRRGRGGGQGGERSGCGSASWMSRPGKPRRRFSSASLSSARLFRADHLPPSKSLTYSSLPPTPITASPPPPPPPQHLVLPDPEPPFSLWDYLREELLATDFDSHQELKWERVGNFLSIPLAIEKVPSSSSCCVRPFIPR